jgi:transcriptional regulator with XRE-family HTH domain
MDGRTEIGDFLTSRRAKITPDQAGLPDFGDGHRRVPGLRREEVALLAGVSVDYYTRLERGNAGGVSDSVLEALARALQLDDAERDHLFDLIRAVNATTATRARRRPAKQHVRLGVQRILDALVTAPAYVRNGRLDILAANHLGRAVFSPLFAHPGQPANIARFIFLDPAAPDFYLGWEQIAADNRGHSPRRSRTRSVRPGSHRPDRRTVHSQRTLPNLVGRAQRAAAPYRRQTPAPP